MVKYLCPATMRGSPFCPPFFPRATRGIRCSGSFQPKDGPEHRNERAIPFLRLFDRHAGRSSPVEPECVRPSSLPHFPPGRDRPRRANTSARRTFPFGFDPFGTETAFARASVAAASFRDALI